MPWRMDRVCGGCVWVAGGAAGHTYTDTSDYRGCFLDHGTTTGFGTPGGSQSNAYAINERGQVIGYSAPPPARTTRTCGRTGR